MLFSALDQPISTKTFDPNSLRNRNFIFETNCSIEDWIYLLSSWYGRVLTGTYFAKRLWKNFFAHQRNIWNSVWTNLIKLLTLVIVFINHSDLCCVITANVINLFGWPDLIATFYPIQLYYKTKITPVPYYY